MTINNPWTGSTRQWQPVPPRRPGTVTAAAVLGFVLAGLAIAGGLVMLASYGAVDAEDRADDAPLVLVMVIVQLACCATLIHASVRLLRGRARGQFQLSLAVMILVCVGYFAIFVERLDALPAGDQDGLTGSLVMPVLFLALAAVALGLSIGRQAHEFASRPNRC